MRRYVLIAPFAFVAAPVLAAGFDLPPRAPGQWEMSISSEGANVEPQVIRMCLDAETDKELNSKFGGMASSLCSKQEQKKEGDALILDSECRIGDMRSESHTVVTGDFNSAYKMKTDVKMSGSNMTQGLRNAAPQGPTSMSTTIEAKRTGDCDAKFKPGDIDLGEGRTMNVRDMPAPQMQ
jgi:hypothetical protein